MWKIEIEITADDWTRCREAVERLARGFSRAKTYRDVPTERNVDGLNPYKIKITAPAVARAKALRDEADRLEAEETGEGQ